MKHTGSKKSERGSAILMTLGILSMVMTLGMIFAMTSRNERTIAMAGADDNRAAMTSESAEAFALSILREMSQTSDTYRPDDLTDVKYKDETDVPRWQPYIGNYKDNGASAIINSTVLSNSDPDETYEQNAVYTTFESADYQASEVDAAHKENWLWTEIENSSFGKLNTNGLFNTLKTNSPVPGYRNVRNNSSEIIGRYGFLILPEGAKFELNALVNPQTGHSVPAMVSKTEVKMNTTMTLPAMPLGVDPGTASSEKETGAFPIMGLGDIGSGDYPDVIDESRTLRYGIHPQELRTAAGYDKPFGNAPKWHDYLQLVDVADFTSKYVLLYRMAGGADEPEMVYDGQDTTTLVENETTASVPELLAKVNLQMPDFGCGGIGWENASEHFLGGASPVCITHADCTWRNNIFLKNQLIGGAGTPVTFLDSGDKDINSHIMANMVDFCDEDSVVTYCIDKNKDIRYPLNDSTMSETVLAGLKDDDKLICGNEAAPSITGVSFEVSIANGAVLNQVIYPDPDHTYYKWNMVQPNTLTLKNVTIALANIYPQCTASGSSSYNVQVALNVVVNEGFEVDVTNPYPGLSMETDPESGDKTFTVVTDATANTVSLANGVGLESVTINDISIPLDETYNALSATEKGGRVTCYKPICYVKDVLVLLHPAAGAAEALADMAYFSYAPDDSILVEYEYNINSASSAPIPLLGFTQSGGETYRGYALVKDPRCNDRSDAWDTDELNITVKTPSTPAFEVEAWEKIVSNCKVTAGGEDKDWEPIVADSSPADYTFSTAYIANEPFTSLWQLGAIHRYEVGRTINLRKYNPDITIGRYEDGDAALLDFYKVTEAVNGIRGKFNPNCFSEGAYRYLLDNIPMVSSDVNAADIYRPTADTSTTIHDTPKTLDDFIDFDSVDDYTDQSWLPMQAFMNFCIPQDGSGSDREIEAFYGCTAGLLSTRYETFSIVTVGQSLQWLEDIEDGLDDPAAATSEDVEKLGGSNPVVINGKWYSVTGSRVQLVTVVRDCWLNTFKVTGRQLL